MPTRGLSRVSWPRPGKAVGVGGISLLAAPWAPGNVVAMPLESAVALSWDYPYNDGNSPVTDYLILPYIGATPQPIIDIGGPQTSFWITGLTDGVTYGFSVMAINAIGSSPWSALSNWATPAAVSETWDVSGTFGGMSYGSGCELPAVSGGPPPSPPTNSVVPVVTGTAQQGQTLSTDNGSWTGTPSSYGYQWQSSPDGATSWTSISGANSNTYVIQPADVGTYLRSQVVAYGPGGSSTPASSVATGQVIALPPSLTSAPVIGGTAQQGQTLTVTSNGGWTNSPTSYGYQWQTSANGTSGWTNLSATASTYVIQATDVGNYLRVQVTAANTGGSSSPASSGASSQVLPAAPTNSVAPTITGTAQQGSTLTAGNGTWTGTPTYTYQWLTSTTGTGGWTNLSGATASTYVVQATDVNNYLSVLVTATNAGGSASASSAATSKVTAPSGGPAWRSASINGEHTTANTVYNKPTGVVSGDWLVIYQFVWRNNSVAFTNSDVTPPSGFTAVAGTWPETFIGGGSYAEFCYIKQAGSSEPSTYTVTHVALGAARGIMFAVSGANATTPISPNPTQAAGTSPNTTNFTGLTTTQANQLIIAIQADDNDLNHTLVAPTGSTPTFTIGAQDNAGNFVAYGTLATAGATGNKTMANNSSSTFVSFGSLIAFQT